MSVVIVSWIYYLVFKNTWRLGSHTRDSIMFGTLLSLERANRKAAGSQRRPTILRSLLWSDQPRIVPSEKTLVWCLQRTHIHDLAVNSHYGTSAHALFVFICRAPRRLSAISNGVLNSGGAVLWCWWAVQIGRPPSPRVLLCRVQRMASSSISWNNDQ